MLARTPSETRLLIPGLAGFYRWAPEFGYLLLRVAMGATIPIGTVFKTHLGVETIFFSFSTSDEDYHAPNEFLRLSNFRLGMTAWSRLLERLAAA